MRFFALIGLLTLTSTARAAPVTVHHQARLVDTFGVPVNRPVDVTFELWTAPTDGTNPFSESFSLTPVDGTVSVELGAGSTVLDSALLPNAWLQIRVDNADIGPRTRLASVPNAAHAERAAGVDASTVLPPCTGANAGAMHFDTATDTLMVCAVGGGWLPVSTTEIITASETWTIGPSGADYPDLQAAFQALEGKRIATTALVTLQIAPGTYNHTSTIDLGHVDGSRIHIIGDVDDPATTVLQFSGSTNGLFLDTAFTLYRVEGITLRGDGVATNRAVQVLGRMDRLGPSLRIENWTGVGVYVYQGVISSGSVQFTGVPASPNSVGLAAYYGASVALAGASFSDTGSDAVVLSGATGILSDMTISGSQSGGLEVRNHGTFLGNDLHIDDVVGTALLVAEGSYMASARVVVSANNNSGLECLVVTENSTAEVSLGVFSHCGGNGIQATYNSFVYANDSSFTDIGESACSAQYRGLVRCQNGTFIAVDDYAASSVEGGMVMLSNPTGTGNLGLHNDAAALHVERADGAIILP